MVGRATERSLKHGPELDVSERASLLQVVSDQTELFIIDTLVQPRSVGFGPAIWIAIDAQVDEVRRHQVIERVIEVGVSRCQQCCPLFHAASCKLEGNDSAWLSGLSQPVPVGSPLPRASSRRASYPVMTDCVI